MFKFFKKKIVEENPKNLQLISLCLAYEVANADNEIDDSEKEFLLRKIREAVDVSVVSENEILAIIENESKKKVSFYDLIHDINKNFVKEEKINILAISTSEIKLSVIIDESNTLKAVKKLHTIFDLD